MNEVTVNVTVCPRCGGYHCELKFFPVNNPSQLVSHATVCPMNGQALVIAVELEKTK